MGLLKQIFGGSQEDINVRYERIRDQNIVRGLEEAKGRGIDIRKEPFKIAQQVELPGEVKGENYWHVADFILAEYSTEIGLQVASAFNYLVPQLGFDAYGKIMVGMQFVDRKAGSPSTIRLSFARDHPIFYRFLTERECPERTEKALSFLGAGLFQFPSCNHAKKIFPTLVVVPEVKPGVIKAAYSIDSAIAEYITR